MSSNNLIIGLAYGYEFTKVRLFLDSLIKISYAGEVVLIGNKKLVIPTAYEKKLKLSVIDVPAYNYGLVWKVFLKLSSKGPLKTLINFLLRVARKVSQKIFLALFEHVYTIQTARYANYYRFLKDKQYKKILLTDVRDVVFQADVFPHFNKGLAAFPEAWRICDDEKFNGYWIKAGFGTKVFNAINKSQIFCSGTILGDHKSIVGFLDLFLKTCVEWKIPHYGIVGIDQGVYNYLLNCCQIDGTIKFSIGDLILTYSELLNHRISFKDGFVMIDGKVPCVVHQFDRSQLMNEYIAKQATSMGTVA